VAVDFNSVGIWLAIHRSIRHGDFPSPFHATIPAAGLAGSSTIVGRQKSAQRVTDSFVLALLNRFHRVRRKDRLRLSLTWNKNLARS
jgi:hypothetical protein